MGLLVLVIALRSWTQVGFTTYVPFYYIEVLHGDPTMVGTLLGVFLGAGVLGTLAAGPIADRVGMRRFMVSTLLLIVPIAVSFLFVSRPYAVLVLGILGFVLVSLISFTSAVARTGALYNVMAFGCASSTCSSRCPTNISCVKHCDRGRKRTQRTKCRWARWLCARAKSSGARITRSSCSRTRPRTPKCWR